MPNNYSIDPVEENGRHTPLDWSQAMENLADDPSTSGKEAPARQKGAMPGGHTVITDPKGAYDRVMAELMLVTASKIPTRQASETHHKVDHIEPTVATAVALVTLSISDSVTLVAHAMAEDAEELAEEQEEEAEKEAKKEAQEHKHTNPTQQSTASTEPTKTSPTQKPSQKTAAVLQTETAQTNTRNAIIANKKRKKNAEEAEQAHERHKEDTIKSAELKKDAGLEDALSGKAEMKTIVDEFEKGLDSNRTDKTTPFDPETPPPKRRRLGES